MNRDRAIKHKKMDIQLFNTIQQGYKGLIESIELDIKSCKKDLALKTKVLNILMTEMKNHEPLQSTEIRTGL